MLNTKVLDMILDVQKQFADLQRRTGLIAVHDDRIHLTEKMFRSNFKEYNIESFFNRDTVGRDYKLTFTYGGVEFMALSDRE